MEVTQFTYFQQCGGYDCKPVSVEITYRIERLAMFIQNKQSVFDIVWQDTGNKLITYGDVYKNYEIEHCTHNFETASIDRLFQLFTIYEEECHSLIEQNCVFLPMIIA